MFSLSLLLLVLFLLLSLLLLRRCCVILKLPISRYNDRWLVAGTVILIVVMVICSLLLLSFVIVVAAIHLILQILPFVFNCSCCHSFINAFLPFVSYCYYCHLTVVVIAAVIVVIWSSDSVATVAGGSLERPRLKAGTSRLNHVEKE